MALRQPQFSSPHLAVRKFFLKTDATRRNQTRKTIGCLTRGKARRDYNCKSLSSRDSQPMSAEQTCTANSSSSNFPEKDKAKPHSGYEASKRKRRLASEILLMPSTNTDTTFQLPRINHTCLQHVLLKQTQELISSHTHDSFISLLLS